MLVQDTYQEPQDTSELDEIARQAWSDYCRHIDSQKEKAKVYSIPKPSLSKRYANLNVISDLLSTDLPDNEERAQATVRDGDASISVLVMMLRKDGQISFFTLAKWRCRCSCKSCSVGRRMQANCASKNELAQSVLCW